MNTTTRRIAVKFAKALNVTFDVGKDKLNSYYEHESDGFVQIFEDVHGNNNQIILKKLENIQIHAAKMGYKVVRVICEPTGGYQNKLLKSARSLGMLTNYVNGEAVSKFRVVESNDSGKTDTKDPRIMHTLGKLNKLIKCRVFETDYSVLRSLNSMYESEEKKFVRQKCQMHKSILNIFCDFDFKKNFLYGTTGRALVHTFGMNPFKITKRGKQYFINRMKSKVPRIQTKTINRLWIQAKTSCLNECPEELLRIYESEIEIQWNSFLMLEKNRELIKKEMITTLSRLRERNSRIPKQTKGIITEFHVARIIAETGPLEDFESIKQLYRYAGLNIREYESCQMKGANRTSKKGRSMLRKTLAMVVLPLAKKSRFYGEYYHERKSKGALGNKLMVNLQRKFLKSFYGWYKSGLEFDADRVFVCESKASKIS